MLLLDYDQMYLHGETVNNPFMMKELQRCFVHGQVTEKDPESVTVNNVIRI